MRVLQRQEWIPSGQGRGRTRSACTCLVALTRQILAGQRLRPAEHCPLVLRVVIGQVLRVAIQPWQGLVRLTVPLLPHEQAGTRPVLHLVEP